MISFLEDVSEVPETKGHASIPSSGAGAFGSPTVGSTPASFKTEMAAMSAAIWERRRGRGLACHMPVTNVNDAIVSFSDLGCWQKTARDKGWYTSTTLPVAPWPIRSSKPLKKHPGITSKTERCTFATAERMVGSPNRHWRAIVVGPHVQGVVPHPTQNHL